LLLSICTVLSIQYSKAGVDFGLSINNRTAEFYLAIGNHFQVSTKQIAVCKQNKIPDEDMPVVFFLARRAHVTPQKIIDLRLSGRTWMEIAANFRLTAEAFYVAIQKPAGPPYGKAYGHYQNKPKKKWKNIKLTDDEITNLVNLRFIANYYGYTPDEVVKMREQGKSFKAINDQIIIAQKKKKAHKKLLAKKKTAKGKKKK